MTVVLGIDTGNRTFGWARFDVERRVFDGVGAHELKPPEGVQKTDGQADRSLTIGGELRRRMIGCDIVIAERMSFPPGGQVAIALGFGVVAGVVAGLETPPALYTTKPQDWQRAVVPESGKKVDYTTLTDRVIGFIRRDVGAARMLALIPPALRQHAIDAGAIAMMGAFRLHECRRVKERDVA